MSQKPIISIHVFLHPVTNTRAYSFLSGVDRNGIFLAFLVNIFHPKLLNMHSTSLCCWNGWWSVFRFSVFHADQNWPKSSKYHPNITRFVLRKLKIAPGHSPLHGELIQLFYSTLSSNQKISFRKPAKLSPRLLLNNRSRSQDPSCLFWREVCLA